jgi:hypothetical protein
VKIWQIIVQWHRALSRGKGGNCHPATRIAGTLYGLQRGGSQDPLDRTNELSYNKGTPFPPTNVQFGYVRWPKITTGRKQQVGLQTTIGTNNSVRAKRHMVGMYIAASYSCLSQVQRQAMLQGPFPHEPFSSATLIIKSFWVKK